MFPLDSRPPHGCVDRVTDDDEHRHPVAVGVINAHRRMLQADGAVCKYSDRLPFDLRIAVRNADRRLFVAARDELRFLIASIVDDRLMERPEAGARIRTSIFNVERSEHIHHEIRPAVVRREHIHFGRRRAFGSCILQRRRNAGWCYRCSYSRRGYGAETCSSGGAFQETTAGGRELTGLAHLNLHFSLVFEADCMTVYWSFKPKECPASKICWGEIPQ